jgi:hypothetical protein
MTPDDVADAALLAVRTPAAARRINNGLTSNFRSPDLGRNGIEGVFKSPHIQYFPQLRDLMDAVTSQLDLWKKPNKTLRCYGALLKTRCMLSKRTVIFKLLRYP